MDTIKLTENRISLIKEAITDKVMQKDWLTTFDHLDEYSAYFNDYEVEFTIDFGKHHYNGTAYLDVVVKRDGQYYNSGDYWTPPEGSDGQITSLSYSIKDLFLDGKNGEYSTSGLEELGEVWVI